MSLLNSSQRVIQSPLTPLIKFLPSFLEVPNDFDSRIESLIDFSFLQRGYKTLDLEEVFDDPLDVTCRAQEVLGNRIETKLVSLSGRESTSCNVHYHPNMSVLLTYLTHNSVGTTFWKDSSEKFSPCGVEFCSNLVTYPLGSFTPVFSTLPRVGDAVLFDGAYHSKAKVDTYQNKKGDYQTVRAVLIFAAKTRSES